MGVFAVKVFAVEVLAAEFLVSGSADRWRPPTGAPPVDWLG
ncbi:MAG: hypothetical protein WBP28_02230 [Nostocoides sp.]